MPTKEKVVLHILVEKAMLKKIDEMAERDQRTRNNMVGLLIKTALAAKEAAAA